MLCACVTLLCILWLDWSESWWNVYESLASETFGKMLCYWCIVTRCQVTQSVISEVNIIVHICSFWQPVNVRSVHSWMTLPALKHAVSSFALIIWRWPWCRKEHWQLVTKNGFNYISQVNGVKLADILFSLLSVCLSVCLCTLSPVFNSMCPSHLADICTLWAPSSLFIWLLF